MRNDLAPAASVFDRLFDVFDEPFFKSQSATFKVDVKDNGTAYELTAELPGMKKEDLSLNYENNYLTISAKKEDSMDEKDDKGNYIRRERSYGTMSRSFYIDGIDESKATASFADGVLTVEMPKTEVKAEEKHEINITNGAA